MSLKNSPQRGSKAFKRAKKRLNEALHFIDDNANGDEDFIATSTNSMAAHSLVKFDDQLDDLPGTDSSGSEIELEAEVLKAKLHFHFMAPRPFLLYLAFVIAGDSEVDDLDHDVTNGWILFAPPSDGTFIIEDIIESALDDGHGPFTAEDAGTWHSKFQCIYPSNDQKDYEVRGTVDTTQFYKRTRKMLQKQPVSYLMAPRLVGIIDLIDKGDANLNIIAQSKEEIWYKLKQPSSALFA